MSTHIYLFKLVCSLQIYPDVADLLAETLIVPSTTPTLFELFCCFRIIRILNRHTPDFSPEPIDGQSDALAHLKSPDTRIEIHHDSTGNLTLHESFDPADRPIHPLFARYVDALTDYSNTLETLTGTPHDPVLYSGRPDLIIECYDTTPDDQLVAVLLGEIKYSDTKQTFKQGLEELLMYRQFADHDGHLTDNPDLTVTNLLITNGFITGGTSDTAAHLNGTDLLTPNLDHQHPPDWIRPLVGPIWNRLVTSER